MWWDDQMVFQQIKLLTPLIQLSCCNRETNDHLQVMFYWITITSGRLQASPPGLKNRVTDNSLCHQERQINIHTGTPACASENRSSLPPGGTITNSISVITHTELPQRGRLSERRWIPVSSTGCKHPPGGVCLKWNTSACVSIYMLLCVIAWKYHSSTSQNFVCDWLCIDWLLFAVDRV